MIIAPNSTQPNLSEVL